MVKALSVQGRHRLVSPLSTQQETEKTNGANRAMEISARVGEQTLHCPSKSVGLDVIFPEDLGRHISHVPSSLWALREFQLLEGTRDARRAAGYLCQITGGGRLQAPCRGSPSVLPCEIGCPWAGRCWKGSKTTLCIKARYLFVVTVAVNTLHLLRFPILTPFSPPMLLVLVPSFGELCVHDNTLERRLDSLGDGDQSDLTPLGVSPLLSPSLASSSSSSRSTYEAWKAGSLTRAMLADVSTSDSISAYFAASGVFCPWRKLRLKGDLYIGRGSRQRSLIKSRYCDTFKVSQYGRDAAINGFREALLPDRKVYDSLWTLSGRRLVCHCRPAERCDDAYDRTAGHGAPPEPGVLSFMAKLREEPDSDGGSSPDEGVPGKSSGYRGQGEL